MVRRSIALAVAMVSLPSLALTPSAASAASTSRSCGTVTGHPPAKKHVRTIHLRLGHVTAYAGASCSSARWTARGYIRHQDRIGSGGFLTYRGLYCVAYAKGTRVRCTRTRTSDSTGLYGPVLYRWTLSFT